MHLQNWVPVLTKGSFNYFIDRNNAFKFQNYAFGAQFRFCFALLELGRFNSLANYLKNKVKKWTITEWNSVARANQFPIIISCSILPKQLDTCRVFCQAFFIRLHVLGRCLLFNLVPGVRFLAFEGKETVHLPQAARLPTLNAGNVWFRVRRQEPLLSSRILTSLLCTVHLADHP